MYRLPKAVFAPVIAAACLLCLEPALAAQSATYPVKPIRFVVGGSPEAVPRILGEKITQHWRQQVLVDQRGGAGGTIAADFVAHAPADGYTLLLCTSTHMMTPYFYDVSYDMVRNFEPVTEIASTSFVLSVHPSLPARSIKALIRLAKEKPGEINYGSSGNGSPAHLIGKMFRIATGTNIVHIPYRTVAAAVTDLMSGQVQMMFVVSTAAVPQIEAGRIRGLAVTALKRSPVVPDLPTLDEAGVRGFEATAWYGVLVPAGTPATVVSRLHDEIVGDLRQPDVLHRITNLGLEPVGSSQQEFGAFVKAELAKWGKVAKASGARLQ